MTKPTQQLSRIDTSPQDIWWRWMPFWHGVFYVPLIVVTALAILLGSSSWIQSVILLGLSLLLGIWYGACVLVSPPFWHQHPFVTLGYLVIGWGLWFGLSSIQPIYLFLLTGLYPQTFVLLFMPWGLIGGFSLTLLCLWQQVNLQHGWDEGAFFTLGGGIMGIMMALFISTITQQSSARKALIQELATTRDSLAQAERQTGIMQERQRLAREIHDTLAQGFTSIIMQIEAVDVSLVPEKEPVKPYLDQIRRIARDNLAEVRRLLWALQPEVFDHASLPEAVSTVTRQWTEESGIPTSVTITGCVRSLLPEIEVTFLRAVQEALANVRKHAHASNVTLTLSYMDEIVALDVQDDGVGFQPAELLRSPMGHTASGFGLKALRERVGQLHGTLTLESAPDEGTTLAIALPALSNLPTDTTETAQETVP